MARRVPAAFLATALLAACTGGSEAEPSNALSTAVSSESSAPASTTVPVDPASSTPSTSTTVVEPTATESAPITTVEATTTAPPTDPEEEVRATLDQSFADFSDCLTSMPFCDPRILEATRAGGLLEVNVGRIEEWNVAGYTVIDRDQYRYVIEAVEIGDDGTTAIAIVCLADGSKLVQPGAGPGGADVIIDDEYISAREAWEMRLDPDGQWRAYSAPVQGVTEESDVCPAA